MDSFGVRYTLEGTCQQMWRISFRHVSTRPVHPKAKPEAEEEFRKGFTRLAEEAVPDGVSLGDVLVYFQDEARIGQKGMLSRVCTGHGREPARASCGTTATDTSTCSLRPAPKSGPQSGMHAQEPTPQR